jgi:hypothetical protein
MSLCTVSVHRICVHPKSYTISRVPSTAFWKIANKYWIFLSTNNTFTESHSLKYKILTWYCSVKLSRHEDWRFCQCCLSWHRLHQLPVFLFVLSCLNPVATLFGQHWICWFANACCILFWSWLSWYDTPRLHPVSIEIMVSCSGKRTQCKTLLATHLIHKSKVFSCQSFHGSAWYVVFISGSQCNYCEVAKRRLLRTG